LLLAAKQKVDYDGWGTYFIGDQDDDEEEGDDDYDEDYDEDERVEKV
jgi:regulator of RNase E activity RraB